MNRNIYYPKYAAVEAYRVAPDNMQFVASWCGGTVKGLALAVEYRCIDFWSEGKEHRAEQGQWVIKRGKGFQVMDDTRFNSTHR